MKYILNRAIGVVTKPESVEFQELNNKHGGDVEALVDAVEPAVRHSHTVIGNGANSINIIGNSNIVNYNSNSREYVETTILGSGPINSVADQSAF